MEPSFVSPGHGITANWANSVVSSIKSRDNRTPNNATGSKRVYKPFDPISLTLSGSSWYITLNEAYRRNTDGIVEILDPAGSALTAYARFAVSPNEDLFYNWKTERLEWHDYSSIGNLKILQFDYDGDNFTITNLHPDNIDLTSYPPFYPLLVKNGSSYEVALTPGKVIEINPAVTGGTCVVTHTPTGTAELTWKAITNSQQASIKTTSNNFGTLSTTEFIVESVDPVSIHYTPPCGDEREGREGEHHYKMCHLDTDFYIDQGGSHIYYTLDIPYLANVESTGEPLSAYPLSGYGRIVKEYIPLDNKFIFRGIKQLDTVPQIHIEEVDTDILIRGNSLSGNVTLKVNDEQISYPLEWRDGLVITNEELDWSIDVPVLSAGDNITINQTDNVYTINATLSGDANPHPWKVTVDGLSSVNIGYGSTYSYDETSLTLREYNYYDGSLSVAVAGTGSIYGQIDAGAATVADINFNGFDSNGDDFEVNLLRVFPIDTQPVSFTFETTPPSSSGVFYFEIAKVEISGGDVVIRQILTHNPTLNSWIEPP